MSDFFLPGIVLFKAIPADEHEQTLIDVVICGVLIWVYTD